MIKPIVGVDCDTMLFCRKDMGAQDALHQIKAHFENYIACNNSAQTRPVTIALFCQELAGTKLSEGKPMVKGVPLSWPCSFATHCQVVLVEADGSRRLPFKAPSEEKGEPAIPDGTTHVIAVAGADIIGQPLNEETVCRNKEVSLLTGVKEGQNVTVECVSSVIGSRHVWNIPENVCFIACLNKVDLLSSSQHIDRAIQLINARGEADSIIITGMSANGTPGHVFKEGAIGSTNK